jgi:hypothetical protein
VRCRQLLLVQTALLRLLCCCLRAHQRLLLLQAVRPLVPVLLHQMVLRHPPSSHGVHR